MKRLYVVIPGESYIAATINTSAVYDVYFNLLVQPLYQREYSHIMQALFTKYEIKKKIGLRQQKKNTSLLLQEFCGLCPQ